MSREKLEAWGVRPGKRRDGVEFTVTLLFGSCDRALVNGISSTYVATCQQTVALANEKPVSTVVIGGRRRNAWGWVVTPVLARKQIASHHAQSHTPH